MAKVRKQLVLEEDAVKCAARRVKETRRKSFNNYVENLIFEDCKKQGA